MVSNQRGCNPSCIRVSVADRPNMSDCLARRAKRPATFTTAACPKAPTEKTRSPLQSGQIPSRRSQEKLTVCLYKVSDYAPYCWPQCGNFKGRIWQAQLATEGGGNNILHDFKNKFSTFLKDSQGLSDVAIPDLQHLETNAGIRLVQTFGDDPFCVGFAHPLVSSH